MPKTLVKPTSKGQVTIPKVIRDKLKVNSDTFLDVSLEGRKIIIQPVEMELTDNDLRVYTDKQIVEFLEEDKLTKEEAEFFNRLLKTNKYG